jgi:hypothetical protein
LSNNFFNGFIDINIEITNWLHIDWELKECLDPEYIDDKTTFSSAFYKTFDDFILVNAGSITPNLLPASLSAAETS